MMEVLPFNKQDDYSNLPTLNRKCNDVFHFPLIINAPQIFTDYSAYLTKETKGGGNHYRHSGELDEVNQTCFLKSKTSTIITCGCFERSYYSLLIYRTHQPKLNFEKSLSLTWVAVLVAIRGWQHLVRFFQIWITSLHKFRIVDFINFELMSIYDALLCNRYSVWKATDRKICGGIHEI